MFQHLFGAPPRLFGRSTARLAAVGSVVAATALAVSAPGGALLATASASGGGQIVVSPGSGTLQKAMDAAGPGTTLRLHGGTYNGAVSAHRSGTASAPITIEPYGDGAVTVTASLPAPNCKRTSPDPNRTFRFDNGVDYWTISNLRIIGGVWVSARNGGSAQHYVSRSFDAGTWQERRSIPGRGSYDPVAAKNAIAELSRRTGSSIDPADGIKIVNNDISSRGIHTIAARYGTISGNEIHNTVCGIGPGVWINTYSDGWAVANNYIHDITPSPAPIHHYMYEGVRLGSASSYNRVEFNRVAGIASDGRAFNTDVDASWNTFSHNNAAGVAIGYNDQASGWGNEWSNNAVDNPRAAGFSFRMKDANLAKPSMNTSTYKSVVTCNHVSGSGVAMQAGALIQSTFKSNYFGTVQLANNLQRYWGAEGNTWNGSKAVPPVHPIAPAASSC